MYVDGFHTKLYKIGTHYRNLNIHNYTLTSNFIHSKEIII